MQISQLFFSAGLDWTLSFNGEPEVRDGKTYMKMVNFTNIENHIDTCKFRLGNLLGKNLGNVLNEFLDENWRELYREINEKIFKNFEVILYDIIQGVFRAIPYEDLFAHDQVEEVEKVDGGTEKKSGCDDC